MKVSGVIEEENRIFTGKDARGVKERGLGRREGEMVTTQNRQVRSGVVREKRKGDPRPQTRYVLKCIV